MRESRDTNKECWSEDRNLLRSQGKWDSRQSTGRMALSGLSLGLPQPIYLSRS
jgi:hypothetical protein